MSYGHDNPPPGFAKCTRPWPHEGPCAHPPESDADTWRGAAQTLAADNARLCEIALAADKMVENLLRLIKAEDRHECRFLNKKQIEDVIIAYTIVRQGQ